MVVGRAIISDLSNDRAQAARAFNIMMTVVGVAPIVAPWAGSLLVGPIGWRGTLWVVTVIAILTLGAVLAFVRESHSPKVRAQEAQQAAAPQSQLSVLMSRRFLGSTLAFALAFGSLMAYISASPFLFQVIVGLSVAQYGLLFAVIAIILTGAGALSAHLSAKVPTRKLLRFGLLGLLVGSALLALLVLLGCPAVWDIAPITLAVGSLGFVLGNATSAAIAAASGAVGAGSAILGALQFGIGAVVAPLVGIAGERSAVPLAIVMLTTSVLALAAFLIADQARAHAAVTALATVE
jgi:DHA1 family bicyclomycin/chloramphenicol resistance-like MFS transporter